MLRPRWQPVLPAWPFATRFWSSMQAARMTPSTLHKAAVRGSSKRIGEASGRKNSLPLQKPRMIGCCALMLMSASVLTCSRAYKPHWLTYPPYPKGSCFTAYHHPLRRGERFLLDRLVAQLVHQSRLFMLIALPGAIASWVVTCVMAKATPIGTCAAFTGAMRSGLPMWCTKKYASLAQWALR